MKDNDSRAKAQEALAKLKDELQKFATNPWVPESMKEQLLGANYFFRDGTLALPEKFRDNLE